MSGLPDIALWSVGAIALWAAAVDSLYMRIPNAVHLALLAVFAIFVLPGLPWQETATRIGIGAILFAVGFGLYAAGMLGAGDVKYLAAAAPLVPPDPMVILVWLLLVTIAGLPVALHRLGRLLPGATRFPSLSETGYFPYGPAISIGLVSILWLTEGPG